MRKISILFGFLVISFFTSSSLYAKGTHIPFGHRENIHKIVDVRLLGLNNEKLFLGYKTDSFYVVAGVFVKDGGYVLGIDEGKGSYYPLPKEKYLKHYQNKNLLPNPLPLYNISIMDYLVGYSLWILIFLFVIYVIGIFISNKNKPYTEEVQSQ